MKQLVIMPGGFHPFHAGHLELYKSAQRAFPTADVKVAATNDTSTRPFPFKLKEKLAQLAGVPPGDFYQVKSPFRAEEITQSYNPADTQLIFVRSEKDANKPPQPGGIKRDGTPAYLQPISDQMAPMTQHAYMTYLPTVEFGPGMTSATEIRTAWPSLNERQRTALVMSLYPNTQSNPKLATTVVKMLDTAMGDDAPGVDEGSRAPAVAGPRDQHVTIIGGPKMYVGKSGWLGKMSSHHAQQYPGYVLVHLNHGSGSIILPKGAVKIQGQHSVDEEVTRQMSQGGMRASYQDKYNQPIAEDYLDEYRS